jgi:hypothetical protein
MSDPIEVIDAEVVEDRAGELVPVAEGAIQGASGPAWMPTGSPRQLGVEFGVTPAPRSKPLPDDSRRCTATSKRTKIRCARFQTPGLRVCRWHGGATQASRALAARNLQTQAAAEIVAGMDVEALQDPVDSLLKLGRRAELIVELVEQKIQGSSDTDATERVALIGAWRGAVQDASKIIERITALNLLARRLEPPDQATARAVGRAVDAAICDERLGLDFPTIETFRSLLRGHMAEAFPEQ